MNFYYVDHTSGDIYGTAAVGQSEPWRTGQILTIEGQIVTGGSIAGPWPTGAVVGYEQSGLYEAILFDRSTLPYSPRFYQRNHPLSFEGDPANVATGRVRESAPAQIPIAELYQLKLAEVGAEDERVRYNAYDTSISANWWIIATRDSRTEIATADRAWLRRKDDGLGWPSGDNQPLLGIYNESNQRVRRERVPSESSWETLMDELAQHDQATGNASFASRTALDDAYADGAGDWEAVAAHDAQDPAWGYPLVVDLPDGLI